MAKITQEEVIKIAHIAHIELQGAEVESVRQQLEGVLNYAARVNDLACTIEDNAPKVVNVFREDEIIPTDAKPILAQAPESEEQFFVVPRILDNH